MCRQRIIIWMIVVLFYSAIQLLSYNNVHGRSFSNTWINLKTHEMSNNGMPRRRLPRAIELMPGIVKKNYTVTFVPLISIIANYLPTFLKRFQAQEVTTARSMNWLLSDETVCTTHRLGRFPNPDNQCQFFECAMNLKNLLNCTYSSSLSDNDENALEPNHTKPINGAIELKSKVEIDRRGTATSLAVMYKVDECVSLILHQCTPQHVYSNRLQTCVPYSNANCPD